jgi:membrane associated rhomboid family serine protease
VSAQPPTHEEPERAPATLALCASWCLVYAAMALHQGTWHAEAGNWLSGGIRPATAYQFGSLTSDDFLHGQWWRAITATFVHYSLVHLLINVVVLYRVGGMVEPWYGPWQFLALYVAVGGLGNALAAIARPWLGQSVGAQSGGGSGFICGLIGMLAVVGWRTKDRFGDYLLMQMAVQLILIGLMGIVIPHVDNLVHASGAAAGALAGLLDRPLIRNRGRPAARVTGVLALAVLAASAVFQYRSNATGRAAQRSLLRREAALARRLDALAGAEIAFRLIASERWPSNWLNPLASLVDRARFRLTLGAAVARVLEDVGQDPEAQQWKRLAEVALRGRPTPGQIHRFLELHRSLVGRVRYERLAIARELSRWEGRLGPPPPEPARGDESIDGAAGEPGAGPVARPAPPGAQGLHKRGRRVDPPGELAEVTADDVDLVSVARPGRAQAGAGYEPLRLGACPGRHVVADQLEAIEARPVQLGNLVEVLAPAERVRGDDRRAVAADHLEQVRQRDARLDLLQVRQPVHQEVALARRDFHAREHDQRARPGAQRVQLVRKPLVIMLSDDDPIKADLPRPLGELERVDLAIGRMPICMNMMIKLDHSGATHSWDSATVSSLSRRTASGPACPSSRPSAA